MNPCTEIGYFLGYLAAFRQNTCRTRVEIGENLGKFAPLFYQKVKLC